MLTRQVVRVAVFFAVSAAIVWLSWRSLRSLRSHGFYRFFAFELLLALILQNVPIWFRDPFSMRQWASYTLGLVSMALAAEGFRLLHVIGKPAEASQVARRPVSDTNLAFENTTQLVTVGAYRLIRHPLYASLLALAWCAYFKDPRGGITMGLTLGATAFLIATAIAEERENAARFGEPYAAYRKRTWRFVPFLF